jgi:hypothetical protein
VFLPQHLNPALIPLVLAIALRGGLIGKFTFNAVFSVICNIFHFSVFKKYIHVSHKK